MKNIAILVPSYNSAETVEATLESILALSKELESHIDFLMLSDDGSKDDTVEIAERIWNHPTVPLLVRRVDKNGGEYRNVNGAFAAMPEHIEWVLIMHADNQALPGWIEWLARECRQAGEMTASICGSWKYAVDGVVVHEGDQRGHEYVEVIPGNDTSVRNTIFKGCWWHNSTAAVRVNAWKAVGGHPQETPLLGAFEVLGLRSPSKNPPRKLRIKGDWDSLLRLLSSGWEIRYIGAPLIRYMELSSSVSAGSFAWHGDLLESLQVMRRHQSVLSLGDITRYHGQVGLTLLRRFIGGVVRGQWRRSWLALLAAPVMGTSLLVSLLNRQREVGGKLTQISFMSDWNPP
jgi:glycosyltransferase involved in cell wall biosynthesis